MESSNKVTKMNLIIANNYRLFEKEVMKYFSYLEQEYGFESAQIKKTDFIKIVRYESPKVFVNMIFGPPDYEVSMSFGRIGIDDKPEAYSFGQGDLITLDSCRDWKWNAGYPNHITGLVAEFARLLHECGSACLKGDHKVFDEMMKRRDASITIWHQEERANRLRKEIESAWHRKDYGSVVSLYNEIIESLTDIEKKRLDYAKKHCN
jgi:hypothetical protein